MSPLAFLSSGAPEEQYTVRIRTFLIQTIMSHICNEPIASLNLDSTNRTHSIKLLIQKLLDATRTDSGSQ